MKKMISLLTFLFIFYFGLQALFVFIGKGHEADYILTTNDHVVSVDEKYSSNGRDQDSYTLTIDVDNVKFNYLVYENFGKSSQIVKKVKYIKDDNYKCIFVKYKKDMILNDILCHNGNYVIPYHNIVNPSTELKQKVDELKKEGYLIDNYFDDKRVVEAHISMVLYSNNHITDHYVGIAENRMLYKVYANGSMAHKEVFTPSSQILHAFAGENYLAFNSNKTDATEYNVYSITSAFDNTITSEVKLGNQTVWGTYNDSVYIYDNTNQKEYEIDLESEKVLEVGSADTKIKYYDGGKWNYINHNEFDINKINFGSEYINDYENPNFAKVLKRGHEVGYYYYFKSVNGKYEVYRSTLDDVNNMTYLFTTDSIDSVKFVDEYIYYINSNMIKHYSDKTGNRTLLYLDGLTKNTLYNVFVEKK